MKNRSSLFLLASLFLGLALFFFLPMKQDISTPYDQTAQSVLDQVDVGTTMIAGDLDPARISSVSQYIAISQLGRSLIKSSRDAQVIGDLANSWEIQDDFKLFKFKLKADQKFSDGNLITGEEILCSFNRQIKLNTAIHFNFDSIKNIELQSDSIEIALKTSNPRFLQQLAHPEFTILNQSNCGAKTGEIDWSITSGAYFVSSAEEGLLRLHLSSHFGDQQAPKKVNIHHRNRDDLAKLLIENRLDFCMGTGELDHDRVLNLKKKYGIRTVVPHIGFTYWLSVNEKHPDLRGSQKEKRLFLINKIHQAIKIDEVDKPYWSKADQMYLPDGNGRLKKNQVDNFWASLEKLENPWKAQSGIKILMRRNFKFEVQIRKSLEDVGLAVSIDHYNNLKQFEEMSQTGLSKYHLIQINNDYSAIDLFENLKVTFNSARPLVFLDQNENEIDRLMGQARTASDLNLAYKSYEMIESLLLSEGLVAPLAYNHMVFFVASKINIDGWSKLYPEVSFWKMRPQS